MRVLQDDQRRCILEDELTDVLEAIRKADTLVLASPVYFGDISGRLKCFFDRTYSFLNPDFSSRLPSGKKAVFILVHGEPEEEQFSDISPRYAHWLKLFGFSPIYQLRATGVRAPGNINRQTRILEQADALGREFWHPLHERPWVSAIGI